MSEHKIYSSLDIDGDLIEVTTEPEHEDDDLLAIVVRQDRIRAAAYANPRQVDELIDALAKHRGRVVPGDQAGYDRRLKALQDAAPLVRGVFGGVSPEQLMTVAVFLLRGAPEVGA